MARQFAFASFLVNFFALSVPADNPWIGQQVLWNDGAKAESILDVAWKSNDELDDSSKPLKRANDLAFRGNSWASKGEFEKAFKDYDDAIQLDANNSMFFYFRGLVWVSLGEFDKAIKDYTEAIKIDPKEAFHYTVRGSVWAMKGEFDKAIKDHAEAMKIDPNEANTYNNLAWLMATCPNERYRDGQKAVTNATRACELTEWKEGANIDTLAAAYAEAGDFVNAIKWQENAIDLMPIDSIRQEMRKHLELYEAGKPCRETPTN